MSGYSTTQSYLTLMSSSLCLCMDGQKEGWSGKVWQSFGCWRVRQEVSPSWVAAPLQRCACGIHTMPVFSWVLRYPPKLITGAPAEDKTEIIFIFVLTFQLPCN